MLCSPWAFGFCTGRGDARHPSQGRGVLLRRGINHDNSKNTNYRYDDNNNNEHAFNHNNTNDDDINNMYNGIITIIRITQVTLLVIRIHNDNAIVSIIRISITNTTSRLAAMMMTIGTVKTQYI